MPKITFEIVNGLIVLGVNYLDENGELISVISICHNLLLLWEKTESKVVKKECRRLIGELLELNE